MTTRTVPQHGDHRLYRQGCRCQDCRNADRSHRKHGEFRRHHGISGHIEGPLVAAHIHTLTNSGWTRTQIAAASGVSDRAIRYILTGQPRMQRRNAIKILSLQPLHEAPRVDTTGTRRRIQALAAIGWPIIHTATLAGVSHRFAFDIVWDHISDIERATAARIAAIYRAHAHKPGPSQFARSIARRNGWHSPLAWDNNIDDPNASPDIDGTSEPELKRDQLAEVRHEEIRHLSIFGISEQEIARRVGVTPKYVREQLAGRRAPGWRNQPLQEVAV